MSHDMDAGGGGGDGGEGTGPEGVTPETSERKTWLTANREFRQHFYTHMSNDKIETENLKFVVNCQLFALSR
jgi:hypothetical protein